MTPQDKLIPKFNVTPLNPVAQEVPVFKIPSQEVPTFQIPEKVEKPGFGGVVLSAIAPVVDVLSRPNYASAKFFDSVANESKGVFESLGDAFNEFVSPKQRLSFSDVIKKAAPQFAKENPKSTAVLGFLADIALDPTTYLGVGFGAKGVKIGGKVVTEFGQEALRKGSETITKKAISSEGAFDLIKALQGELARKSPNVAKVGFLSDELNKVGYFEAVGKRSTEIEDFATSLGAKTDKTVLNNIASGEVFDDLKRGLLTKANDLTSSEVRERVEERIVRLTETDKDLISQIFRAKSGLKLTIGVPFGPEKVIPYSEEAIRYIGLEPLKQSINLLKKVPVAGTAISKVEELGTKFGEQVKGLFVRPGEGNLPGEQLYKKAVTKLENMFDYLSDDTIRVTQKLFKDVDEVKRTEIGRVMREIDDASRLEEDALQRYLKPEEAEKIYNRILGERGTKLDTQSRAIIGELQQNYKTAMELEMEAGLLKQGRSNYSPRVYEIISDPEVMTAYRKQKLGLATYLPSSQERKFLTLNDAEVAGFVPEMDAAMLYAQRMLSSRRNLAIKQFQDSVKDIYGLADNVSWGSKEMSSIIPRKIIDDMKILGESVYPTGMNESMRYFLQGYDKLLSGFRKYTTVVKPSFAPKQFISNTFQSFLQQGLPAFKAFDPRALIDTALVFTDIYRNKNVQGLPPTIGKLFGSSPDSVLASRVALSKIIGEERLASFTDQFSMKTVLGENISGTDFVKELREYGIIKGVDSSGDRFTKTLEEGLKFNPNSKLSVTKQLASYWKFPSIVEDYSRATSYNNFRRMGYSPRQAADEVNKSLFDYSRGLTSFEKNVARRLIPFYTYQRFAIPFVLRKLIEKPGTASAGQKFVNMLEKLMVDDTEQLSPAEREIFGNSFLIEQPRVFLGFDNTGKAKFNVFNNMTPLDALSFFVYDKEGKFDLERTVQKTVLGALTPFIKIPIEAAIDKNFFTGKAVSEGGKLGDLKNSISVILPKSVKDAIGYEDRVNMRTGKTTTYINPYLAYFTFSIIPALKQFINPLDAGTSPLDSALNLITGITPVGMDLKEAEQFQQLGQQKQVSELQRNIRLAKLRGSENEYEKNLKEYQEYVKLLMIKRQAPGEVRGAGLSNPEQTSQTELIKDLK